MAEPDDYNFCYNDLEVKAGDRTSYKTSSWWQPSDGLCDFAVCGAEDVRAWFAAADRYINKEFKPHFERYKSHIQMAQGAASVEQQQVIKEAQGVLDAWSDYAKHYRKGGGGPVGASFQPGGYSWESPEDADPAGPSMTDFFWVVPLTGGIAPENLSREIVDHFDKAACLRNKFNESKPEGMLPEIPGYGGSTKRPAQDDDSSGGMGITQIAVMGLGAWVLLKALSE